MLKREREKKKRELALVKFIISETNDYSSPIRIRINDHLHS